MVEILGTLGFDVRMKIVNPKLGRKRLVRAKVAVACFAFAFAASSAFTSEYSPEFMQAMTKGAKAQVSLRVVDDEGAFVPRVKVRVQMGMNFEEKSYWIDGETDENGLFLVEGVTTGNKIAISLSKDGYYNSNRELHFIRMGSEHAVKDGKWQPWGKDERILLRKIREQIQPITHGGPYDIPKTNEWVSFDMLERDWVAPFGKGKEADVEFLFSWYGKDPLNWERQRFGVRFPGNPYNGGYLCGTKKESSFPYAFRAATGNTDFHRELFDDMNRGKHRFGMLDGTSDFVFRIRSVTNRVGRLLSCNYGRFRLLDYGVERTGMGSMMMRYDYNPSSMDTNLEFKKWPFLQKCG